MPHNRCQAIIGTAVDAIITADASGDALLENLIAIGLVEHARGTSRA